MVSYSPRAAKALSFLKKPYNDVEIFVEDTGNHNMWLLMVRNILPSHLKISSVNLLGGRRSVVEACRLDQATDGRRKLYIIDGDFDHLIGVPKPKLKYLYRIQAYCVENLLINKNNCVQVGMVKNFKLTESQIESRLQYDLWMSESSRLLTMIFRNYAAARKIDESVSTIGYSVRKLFGNTSSGPVIDKAKAVLRAREISATLILNHGEKKFLAERRRISIKMKSLEIINHISGKDYLLPLVHARLTAQGIFSGSLEALKVQLARSWAGENERGLCRRVKALAKIV
jgi:hypothetical protein